MSVIYAKYSRQRLPRFQTETTVILLENGARAVRKKPCTAEANEHINQMIENYSILKHITAGLNIVEARAEENGIICEYVEGKSLDKIIFEVIMRKDKEMLLDQIGKYAKLIKNAVPGNMVEKFSPSEGFIRVFGEGYSGKSVYCLEVGNVDLIFENIILDELGKYRVIDYEWIFRFPIPVDIILYRSVIVLWYKYNQYLSAFVTWEELMACVGLRLEDEQLLRQSDLSFQSYVYGNSSKYWISPKYLKQRISLTELLNRLEYLEHSKTNLETLIEQKEILLEEKDKLIRETFESLNDIYSSRSWRLANRVRKFKTFLCKRKK